MNDTHVIASFVRQSLAHARTLPLTEARIYLHGLMLLTEGEAGMGPVRIAYQHLCESDAQLELIASGQLRLPLEDSAS
jgi:pyridoxal biosynthesis lyase PdxS